MPTREEIVSWLRDAAISERSIAVACATGSLPLRFMQESIDKAVAFEQRAAQVDAMRCESCRHWHVVTGPHCECHEIQGYETVTLSSFGCFSYETKPAD